MNEQERQAMYTQAVQLYNAAVSAAEEEFASNIKPFAETRAQAIGVAKKALDSTMDQIRNAQ